MHRINKYLAIILFFGLLTVGCDDKKDFLVTIHTQFGDMKVILFNETPLHKSNFLKLAQEGRYDSTEWHRVIEGFMIQGGNVFAKEGEAENEENRIPAEFNEQFYHTKGALAAARQGDQINPEKMSSGSQFYIVQGKVYSEEELTTDQYQLSRGLSQCLGMPKYDSIYQKFVKMSEERRTNEEINQLALEYVDLVEEELGIDLAVDFPQDRLESYITVGGTPHLDDQYTVFGRVVEGLGVIDEIAAVQTGRGDRPVEPIYLTMEVEKVPKKQITEKYGYKYPAEE